VSTVLYFIVLFKSCAPDGRVSFLRCVPHISSSQTHFCGGSLSDSAYWIGIDRR